MVLGYSPLRVMDKRSRVGRRMPGVNLRSAPLATPLATSLKARGPRTEGILLPTRFATSCWDLEKRATVVIGRSKIFSV
jgi:hypothetical protein